MGEKWQYPPPAPSRYPIQPRWQCHLSRNPTSERRRAPAPTAPSASHQPSVSVSPPPLWLAHKIHQLTCNTDLLLHRATPPRTSPGTVFSALAFPCKLLLPPKNLKNIQAPRNVYVLLKYSHHRGWKQKVRDKPLKHPLFESQIKWMCSETRSHHQNGTRQETSWKISAPPKLAMNS